MLPTHVCFLVDKFAMHIGITWISVASFPALFIRRFILNVITSHGSRYFCVGSYFFCPLLLSVQYVFNIRQDFMSSQRRKCIASDNSRSNVLDWFIIHDSAILLLWFWQTIPSQISSSVTSNIEYLYIRNYGTDNDRIFEYTIFSRTLYSNLRFFLSFCVVLWSFCELFS